MEPTNSQDPSVFSPVPPRRSRQPVLSADPLWEVFRNLTRIELEGLLFTTKDVRSLIQAQPNGPRRSLQALLIGGTDDFTLIADKAIPYREQWQKIRSTELLVKILKNCAVDELRIHHVNIDDAFLNVLVQMKSSWEYATAHVKCDYATDAVLRRAFNEAFFCHKMNIEFPEAFFSPTYHGLANDHTPAACPLFSLEAVRQCQQLELVAVWSQYFEIAPEEIAEWLHRSNKWDRSTWPTVAGKKLVLRETKIEQIRTNVYKLIDLLKKNLLESQSTRSFTAKLIYVAEGGGQETDIETNAENALTAERLVITTRKISFGRPDPHLERDELAGVYILRQHSET